MKLLLRAVHDLCSFSRAPTMLRLDYHRSMSSQVQAIVRKAVLDTLFGRAIEG